MKTAKQMQDDFLKKNKVTKIDDAGVISVRLNGAYCESIVLINPSIEYIECIENKCNNKIENKKIQKRCPSCAVKIATERKNFEHKRKWCETNNKTLKEYERYALLYKKYKKPMFYIAMNKNTIKEIEELLKIKEIKNIRLKLNYIRCVLVAIDT
tara:strand:- start:35 stop:499 length:465 start_codon:yes stop_codon:yes gene_type:complete